MKYFDEYYSENLLSEFIKRYLEIIQILVDKNYHIDEKYLNILNYKDIIQENIKSNWQDAKIFKSCLNIYNKLKNNNIYQQELNILEKFGVTEAPEKVLYEEKHIVPSRKFITIQFMDGDSFREEKFYSSGKSTTVKQFIKEFKNLYKNCNINIYGYSQVEEDPQHIIYQYYGYHYE